MANTLGTLPAKQDANQEYTLMGISGTLGPTYGTAEPRPLTLTEDGKLRSQTDIALTSGTLSTLGTVDLLKTGTITRLEGGSIAVTAGTVVVTSGTQQTLGTVGTLQGGTLTRLEGGTLGLITTVSNLSAGSVAVTAGTVIVTNGTIGAGTVAISLGTVGGKAASGAAAVQNPVFVAGTDAGGTIYGLLVDTKGQQFLSAGTITRLEGGTLTRISTLGTMEVGTILALPNIPGGTLGLVTTVSNLTNGSVRMTVGTLTEGTLTRVGNVGTVESGTVRVNSIPVVHTQTFGTTTTGTIGTLVAAPSAGSAVLIDSLDVNLQNGTAEVVVSYGLVTTGNGVVTRGNYVAGGGISKNPTNSIGGSTTGSALTYNILSGSGTVSYSIAYKIAIP